MTRPLSSRGQAARSAGGACPDNDEEADAHAVEGAGNSGESRGSARADNNRPKIGSNSSRNGVGDGGDGGNRSSGSSNGDGGNGGDNAAAMAAVTAAPT